MAGVSSDSFWVSCAAASMWSNPMMEAQAQAQTQNPVMDFQEILGLAWEAQDMANLNSSSSDEVAAVSCLDSLNMDGFSLPHCTQQHFLNRGTEPDLRNPMESLKFLYSMQNSGSSSSSSVFSQEIKQEPSQRSMSSLFHGENQETTPTTAAADLIHIEADSSSFMAPPLGSQQTSFTGPDMCTMKQQQEFKQDFPPPMPSFMDNFTVNDILADEKQKPWCYRDNSFISPPSFSVSVSSQPINHPGNPSLLAAVAENSNPQPSHNQKSHLQQFLQQARNMNNINSINQNSGNSSRNLIMDAEAAAAAAQKEPKKNPNETCSSSSEPLLKRPRLEAIAPAPAAFKVRKEKLGDRITALQQLVSPFGKTDTASVLLEAIGYIKYLHEQLQVLSTPCIHKAGGSAIAAHQQQQQQEENKESDKPRQDLRSRGLCLVPVSCTANIAAAVAVADPCATDYWSPSLGYSFNFLS